MRLNKTDFLRKAQHPLLLGLASLPLAMMLILTVAGELFPWCWCFPAAYVLLSWGCLLLPGRKRLPGGLAGAALLAAGALLSLPWRDHFVLLLLPVMYIVLLLMTLPIGGWPYNRELAVGWHVSGVLTHLLMQLLLNGSQMTGTDTYLPARLPLLFSFLAYAVLVLLALNRASLDSAAQSRRKVPLLMRRQNLILTLALLLIGVLVAAIPAIGAALSTLWDYVLKGISLLMALIAALLPQKTAGGGGGPGGAADEMGFGEANPPSAFAVLMEKIIGYLALIILVVGLILLLRVIGRKLVKLFRYLLMRMQQYSAAAGEDYEDEITSTRDEADVERESLLTRLRRAAPGEEKGRTPTERVRLRYKRLKQKRDWSAASTARETLPGEAAALYERARYGGHALSEAEAERFREETKKV